MTAKTWLLISLALGSLLGVALALFVASSSGGTTAITYAVVGGLCALTLVSFAAAVYALRPELVTWRLLLPLTIVGVTGALVLLAVVKDV